MSFVKRYRILLIFGFGIIILYFFTRLYNILELPIFTDEAIYVRWSQIAKQDANWRFISLTDGKQPSLVWFTMIAMRFVEDPLLAGRLVSVVAGFFTLLGLFLLGREIFRNIWIGVLSSFLYAIYPMALVYDRMALYDSLVGTFSVWSLYLAVFLVRKLRLDVAFILAMVAGAGVLTKTSGFFSIYLLPFTLLIFDFAQKDRTKRIIKWAGLALVSVVLTYMFYSILRLSPFFHIISEKNALFVYPLKDWLNHPFNFFVGNWKAVWDWLTRYMTWPITLLIISSFFLSKNYFREKTLLFIWFLIPAISLAVFGRTLYPRFIFFMTLPLLPLVALSLFNIYLFMRKRVYLMIFLFIAVFSLVLKTDYFILSGDLKRSGIPRSDFDQYFGDWPAGVGVKEVVEFFRNEAEKGKIYIATQGTFGLMPYALEIYLIDNPDISIEGYWPIGETIPEKVLNESKKRAAYFVFYQPCTLCPEAGSAPSSWGLGSPIIRYAKYYSYKYFSVYKIP